MSSVFSEEMSEDLAVMRDWEPKRQCGEDIEAEFMTFMDREKSKGKCFQDYERSLTDHA